MSESNKALRFDEKLKAEDLLYTTLFHTEDKRLMTWAVIGAVVVHVVVLFLHFPEVKRAFQPEKKKVVVVRKYVPPPPPVQRRQVQQRKITKKVPVPDPTPDEPEPIREPEPEIQPEPLPPDVDILIGDPEPPPPSGPLMAGVGDVTNPVRIEETYVQPEYPELARRARLEANVILQAIVHKDGTVGDITVLKCNRPNVGFEDSAVEAVQQWRYQPASQGGKPVDVYFTIVVDFELQ